MADNVAITAGSGTTIGADEVVDGTLGTVKVQFMKIMDGTLNGTDKATVKAASTAPVAADPALVVALSPNSEVAKGTQGTTALPVQDLKDSGRTYITLFVDNIAGVTTEALASTVQNKGGSTSSATNFSVTTGKTFRVTSINVSILGTTTTAATARARLRTAASSIATSSPVVVGLGVGMPVAVATAGAGNSLPIDDGIEIAASQQYAIGIVSSTTACSVSVCVTGYEY